MNTIQGSKNLSGINRHWPHALAVSSLAYISAILAGCMSEDLRFWSILLKTVLSTESYGHFSAWLVLCGVAVSVPLYPLIALAFFGPKWAMRIGACASAAALGVILIFTVVNNTTLNKSNGIFGNEVSVLLLGFAYLLFVVLFALRSQCQKGGSGPTGCGA